MHGGCWASLERPAYLALTARRSPGTARLNASLEAKLAAVRRAIAQGSNSHKLIMHGRQYAAYDYGEAPADHVGRAEQEGLGFTLVDL